MCWKSLCLVLLAGVATGVLIPSCNRGSTPPKIDGHNILFITLDTTRADRIGSYGYPKAQTPVIDGLAARGVLFENAISQVPLTLPSHASMLTGLYPREHGVRDNGRNAVGEHHPTLATIFKEKGYRTGAFIASFVLDSQFGLARGFDVYEDDMGGETHAGDPFHAQQPANVVTDRTLAWLTQKSDQPFFAWVHYYDAHDPYAPPPEFRSPDRDLYDGELAFIDSQLKRIFDWLAAEKLNEKTLVIIAGDHGESFNEHGERGHTNFVYATNMHVPLIFVHPAAVPSGKRERAVVELVDLFPTVLDLFGIPHPVKVMSRSLTGVFAGRDIPSLQAYSESLYVFNSYGWAEQRALTTDRWKYISSTHPELYDLSVDVGETRNLVLDQPRVASDLLEALKARFDAMPMGTAEEAEASAAAGQTLESLGYFGGSLHDPHSEVFLSVDRRDPKDMRKLLELFRVARTLMERAESETDYAAVVPLIRDIALECPDALQFHYVHGFCLIQAGRAEEALEPLRRAIEIDKKHRHSVDLMAEALTQLNRHAEAINYRKLASEMDPFSGRTSLRYALALDGQGQKAEAIAEYRKSAKLSPDLVLPYARLCKLCTDIDEIRSLLPSFKEAIVARQGPEDEGERAELARAEAWHELGSCHARIPDYPGAVEAFQQALQLEPKHPQALCNIGIVLLKQSDGAPDDVKAKLFAEARAYFERAVAIEGFAAEGTFHLAESYRVAGDADKAAQLYHQAIQLKPTYTEPVKRLTLHYRQREQFQDMVTILNTGVTASPDDVWLLGALGQMLATSGDPSIADCSRAVTLLDHAAQLTSLRDPLVLANLCAAYACNNQFEKAASACRAALPLAQQGSTPELEKRIQQQLDGIGRKEPYRDPKLSKTLQN